MEYALSVGRPANCYKVGPDSKAAPIVGLLPVAVSEWILKQSIYQRIGSV